MKLLKNVKKELNNHNLMRKKSLMKIQNKFLEIQSKKIYKKTQKKNKKQYNNKYFKKQSRISGLAINYLKSFLFQE